MAKTTCPSCKGAGWWCTAYGQAKCECSASEDCKFCSGMGFLGSDDVAESENGEVTFTADEMVFIKAVFSGDCSPSKLSEGGDYMRCFGPDWTEYELNKFLNKIEGHQQ